MLKQNKLWSFVLVLITAIFMNCNVQENDIISKQLFDLNWKFHSGDSISAFEIDFDDENWQSIDLPYNLNGDWDSIDTEWYRKHFVVPENWINKDIVVFFEGISEQYEIWINGNPVSNSLKEKHSFQTKINPYLNNNGTNVIAVRITKSDRQKDSLQPEFGIFKHVWLVISSASCSK